MEGTQKGNPWYLLFWPAFGLRYCLIERCDPAGGCHPVACGLDDRIPFLEIFLIPYLWWYVCIMGMHLWLCFHDAAVFRKYSRYLMVSMVISTAVFLLWPSCQNLRPEHFPRDNGLTRAVAVLYRLDTNTNVFPSEHVIGAAGVFLAAVSCEKLGMGQKRILGILCLLTAASTVFLKQHSVLDAAGAVPVCLAGWLIGFDHVPAAAGGTEKRKAREFLP